jgi:hypothetical protein
MARIEEHMEDCERVLGKPYREVHEFLDQYAEVFPVYHFNGYHRSFLHNKYGIEVVRAMWGIKAGQAAIIHIVRDYLELPVRKWKAVNIHYGKALMYFNQLNNFDPQMQPYIIAAWERYKNLAIYF